MQVELSTAIAIGSAIFAAGGAWISLKSTARSARLQGVRIGKLEMALAEMKGEMRGAGRVRTKTAAMPGAQPEGED